VSARRPLYSACNEDSRTELRALAPERSDTVVCIAAGGGRALSLLGAAPARLLAVDRRADQLAVLELKAAALDAWPLSRLRAFLGVDDDRDRLDAYAVLRPALSPAARRYWDARRILVRDGALYAGRLETVLARQAEALRRLGLMRWPRACFAARTLEEQRIVLARAAREVARGAALWRWLLSPLVQVLALRDPSFLRSTEGPVGAYLYRRLVSWVRTHLVRESALLHLLYHGRYDPGGALPVWLTPEGAERARKHVDRLVLRCTAIERVPASIPRDTPVHWSLSDVSAWMPEPRWAELLADIASASPPGSRLCWRHLAARWAAPRPAHPTLRRLPAAALERDDTSVFYSVALAERRPVAASSGARLRADSPRRGNASRPGGLRSGT
jgi:S-adenosylmethionine-diacylglycerol 3-amino-3-carboxypropyl transferase